MQSSIRKYALVGCATTMVGGCAVQQNAAPEYRLSSSAPQVAPGSSMLQRGRAQLDAGLDALAIEAFRAEIRVNPDSADAYNGLAVAYGRIGRDDLAQRYFETALAKDPGNGKAQANLARLTGDAVPVTQLAEAHLNVPASEPVAVATVMTDDPIGQLIESIETPTLASSIMISQPEEKPVSPVYALARQGVLSTRFAVAPARFVTVATSVNSWQPDKPVVPPSSPAPALPVANLPADYRATATRLVRVSLGEVHLVTRSTPPVKAATSQPEFKSFGDRLASWLPQSIAVEQARAGNVVREGSVLMAAIERAELGQKVAVADDAGLPEMPEFAYLSFDVAEPVANV
jgi:hypothetical protein